jgi:hypothetical protein
MFFYVVFMALFINRSRAIYNDPTVQWQLKELAQEDEDLARETKKRYYDH